MPGAIFSIVRRVIDTDDDEEDSGVFGATWVLVTSDGSFFDKPPFKGYRTTLLASNKLRMWTDDYSNLFRILK